MDYEKIIEDTRVARVLTSLSASLRGQAKAVQPRTQGDYMRQLEHLANTSRNQAIQELQQLDMTEEQAETAVQYWLTKQK